MADSTSTPLPDLAAKLEAHVNELRRAGDHAALLAAASAAAEEIERRAGANGDNGAEREALTRAQRFMFNAAADCWPGWTEPERPTDTEILRGGLSLAQRPADIVAKLGLGQLRVGTGTWLIGGSSN